MLEDILPVIRNRKSNVVFTDQKLTNKQIQLLLKAAQWAPSCFNTQEWRFTLVMKETSSRKELEDALNRGNSWAKAAPLLIVISADPLESCMPKRNYHAYDSGLAVMCLVLQAEYMGLRAHQMAGWKTSEVRKALSIPDPQKILAVIAVGYEETDPNNIKRIIEENPRMEEKIARTNQRTRNPISDFTFDGIFGKAYSLKE